MSKNPVYQRMMRLGVVFTWAALIMLSIYILTVYLYPFLIGLLISFLLLPIVNFIERIFSWKRSVAVLFVIASFVLMFSAGVTLLVAEIVAGLGYLKKELPHYIEDGFERLHQWFDATVMPFYESLLAFTSRLNPEQQSTLDHSLETLLSDISAHAGTIVQHLLNGIADFLLSLPNMMTIMFFALLGAFFITKDWPVMAQWLEIRTPNRVKRLSSKLTEQWKLAIRGYILAQLVLVMMTGIIVLIGLLIINVEYAVTTALLIALIDLFPYLGTGLVFIPWVIYAFISGHWNLSIGLSILYAIVIIQRQFSEPKVMSRHMGIPPLALLITLFACYQLFGVLGLLFGPALLIFIQSFIRAGVIDEITAYIKGAPR
ncbi:sporulation integral membrane protein YtvI [Evansella caseinilytica]|uniref:Sporulation integral membrane protein YtvI n=1 Tax=Evansella caseinilytica TaxID=1503961 RepID=A0A1H3TWP6_9BACI|nr:sporulation integral membrane protein YtvI [Evansella caseinilytica]SDZ54478.1 sporulation integral membrane protein YtvI [Evansella caseinilytica]